MANIVLSSSPSCSPMTVTPPHATAANTTSSPELPSPSRLLSSMGTSLMSGGGATPIPTDAVTGFAGASTLLSRARSMDEVEPPRNINSAWPSGRNDLPYSDKVTKEQPQESGGDKKKVPTFKKPKVLHTKHPESIHEKVTRTAAVRPHNAVEKPDTLAPKKSRKKKSKDESEAQTTIKKTKIVKPGAVNSSKKALGSTKTAKKVDSAPPRPPASTQEEDLRAKEEFRDLCLEKAITRRKEWTPCKDTAPDPTLLEDFEKSVDSKLLGDKPLANAPLIARFGNLLNGYGFAQNEDSSVVVCETTRQGDGEAIVKRRKIELVNDIPAPRVSKRSKSPKKKPQTVTGKATAPFAPAKSMVAPSLLQYFGTPTAESAIPVGGETDNPDLPMKKMATSKPKTSKVKKPVQKQPILLSPESAMKNARNQELIFGTSSQLAREDSPTFIKDLQQATKESKSAVEHEQPPEKDYEFLDVPSGRSRSSNVRAIMASRSLWSAASRDIDGSLVEVEIVNLVDTSNAIRAATEQCAATERIRITEMSNSSETKPEAEDNLPSRASAIIAIAPQLYLNKSPDLQQSVEEPDLVMPRSVAEATLRNRPKSTKKTRAANPATNEMPNYEGFTDVQLRNEITANGFKAIKKRETMIKLVKQCWKSKMSMALQEVPANVSLQQPVAENESFKERSLSKRKGRPPKSSNLVAAAADHADDVPPKKPRGRPKKDPTAAAPVKRKRKTKAALSGALVAAADDEIYDSNPPTPSPPRRRLPPKLPGQLQLSQPLETSTADATTGPKDNNRALLFSQITKAVTTFPPTHDVKNLTWYEKMLMYDPIVLEDLTIWLNTEGLGRVGEDDEVCPGLVKEWCEERSVCCLWRENLRGGARGRW